MFFVFFSCFSCFFVFFCEKTTENLIVSSTSYVKVLWILDVEQTIYLLWEGFCRTDVE